MKIMRFTAFIVPALALAACASNASSQAAPTAIPTVKAPGTIIAQGRLEPVRFAQIALNASGLVSEVMVKEGDQVTSGYVLATLQGSDAQTLEGAKAKAAQQLNLAYQNLRDAQSKLDNFDIPSDFAGLTPTAAVAQTLDALNTARAAFQPYKYAYYDNRNVDLNLSDPTTYKILTKRVNGDALEARRSLDAAWNKYRTAVQWMGLESDLETAQANLDQAMKNYKAVEDPALSEDTAGVRAALANAELRAPFAGTVTDLKLKAGEFAASGQPVVTVADTSSWVVKTTDLTEINVVTVKPGQSVSVTLDAIPGVEFKGTVLSIGNDYSKNQGDIVYEVTVVLTDRNPAMRWGMTAAVKFAK